jgi:hypothetical protein
MAARRKTVFQGSKELQSYILGQLTTGLMTQKELGIVEFAEQICFNGKGRLFLPQKALLKSFYSEPLDEQEIALLKEWQVPVPGDLSKTNWKDNRQYVNLVLCAGRGGSKSTLAAFIVAYEFYKLICLDEPQIEMGLLPNSPIHIFVVATSQEQVNQTIYGSIKGLFNGSDYFKQLEERGEISIMAESIKHKRHNISILPKHTNTAALVGFNIKCIVLDEICRFESIIDPITGETTSKAHDLWDNVGGPGVKRFTLPGRHKKGIRVAVSSAWQDGDPMEAFQEMAERSTETLRFNLTTFDLNTSKTKEEYADEYAINTKKALLEYENIRSKGSGGFYDETLLDACRYYGSILDTREHDKKIVYKNGGKDTTVYYLVNDITRIEKLEEAYKLHPAFAHVDFSKRRDATAVCICRPLFVDNIWKINVEALVKWQPYMGTDGYRREVWYEDVEKVIDLLIDNRELKYLSFDTYNNSATLQKYQKLGINCVEASTTTANQLKYFTLAKQLVIEDKLLLPKDGVNTGLLIQQLCQLIIHPSTGKIKHGIIGKDLADAFVNSIYQCYEYMVGKRLFQAASNFKGNKIVNPKYNAIANRTALPITNKYNARSNLNRILKKI